MRPSITASPASTAKKLVVKYKDGDKKIIVPPTAEIATYAKRSLADLKAGEKIFIAGAKKNPDGTLEAANISFGDYAVWRCEAMIRGG